MNSSENLDATALDDPSVDLHGKPCNYDPNLGKTIVAELRKMMADFISAEDLKSTQR